MQTTRRQFLGSASLSLGSLPLLFDLRPVSAEEAKLPPSLVRMDSGIEPTVRLLEDTSRDKVLEEVGSRVKAGLSYREILAALLLAGVRNVQPRPHVGFKFHAVLVIHSAHLASLNSADSDRWLPIFWAIDRFKSAQEETQRTSGWRMAEPNEAKLPPAEKARQAFIAAMDQWDEQAADAAAVQLSRTASRDECFELFVRYGARDFRDIGHKAIYVANSFRTLAVIGWQYAEPVLRSLAYALLAHEGGNPAQADLPPDRPWRQNAELLKQIKLAAPDPQASTDATAHLLSVFRAASAQDAPLAVVEALNHGASVASVWDAIFAAAGELLMRKTNILTLHSVTSANALHFAWQTAATHETRMMALLQNAAFLPLFREAVGKMGSAAVDGLEPAPASDKNTVDDIFAAKDRPTAASKALAFLNAGGPADELMHTARRLVFLKGTDAHDYKFSSAVLEDFGQISPAWRNRVLATSLFYLPGSGRPDNELVKRIRAVV
jgi:hypothetical protein